jgi:hypothetical protein
VSIGAKAFGPDARRLLIPQAPIGSPSGALIAAAELIDLIAAERVWLLSEQLTAADHNRPASRQG